MDISVKIHQAVLHRFFHESIVVYLELLRFRTFHDLSLQKWWGVRNVEGNFFGTLPYWGVRDWRGRHLHATRPICHGQNMVYGLWSSSHPSHIWNPYIYKHTIYIQIQVILNNGYLESSIYHLIYMCFFRLDIFQKSLAEHLG